MRVGILCRMEEMDRAHQLGFRSMALMRFAETPMASANGDWQSHAEQFRDKARQLGLRISCLGVFYRNALDPRQTESARALLRHGIKVAAHIGVNTIGGFAGAVIETELNDRGGNPVYKPFENYISQAVAFWDPIAQFAKDHGVRIAFENCPQGQWFQPIVGYNMFSQPAIWERFFNATKCDNIGIEWDASHLVCQFIDPVENIRRFGSKIFHVHAKDAWIDQRLLSIYGICHPGVMEHRHVGFGQSNWAQIVHMLHRVGYDSDLNIEGFHDPVFRDHDGWVPDDLKTQQNRQSGQKLEQTGCLVAKRTLEQFIAATE